MRSPPEFSDKVQYTICIVFEVDLEKIPKIEHPTVIDKKYSLADV